MITFFSFNVCICIYCSENLGILIVYLIVLVFIFYV